MRTRFLVKPAFQFRHLAWTLAVVTLCVAACWVVVEAVVANAMATGVISDASWALVRVELRLGFGVVFIMASAFAGVENYLFFHRIAGPLFALERAIRNMTTGDFETPIRIRESDQVADLIKAFEEMRTAMKAQIDSHEKTAARLSGEISRCLDSASFNNLDALRQTLQDIRERVEKRAA